MLRNVFTIVIFLLLFATNVASANQVSEDSNLNVTSLDETLPEDGFAVSSTAWSPDGQRLLVTCSKSISRSSSIHSHYLLDTNSHTFGEIDYGTKEFSSYSIPKAEWSPSGDRIYFKVSKFASPTDSGNCFIICNPDGTNLRGIGTNYTDLSSIIKNVGDIGFQRNLNWNTDSSKIVFEWEKPGNISTGVYIADGNGTNTHEIQSKASCPVWYDSNEILIATDEGTVEIFDNEGNAVPVYSPENEIKYVRFSLSPDRKKILLASTIDNFLFQTYISNSDGSNLKKHISNIDGSLLKESITSASTAGAWQPNGSLLLINQNESLYIVEGDENNKRLLYEGNASEPQWFPDGKNILFVEDKNKLYSIDVDGTNLSFIANFGPTPSYLWNFYDETQKFSISPSGNLIAFTSALDPATGEITENELDPSKYKSIAASLFIVNSSGSNLTQVTPATKGKYDIFIKWSPTGKQFTIGSKLFSKDGWNYGDSSLIELNSWNSSSVWKSLPVKEIIGGGEPISVNKTQNDESNSANTSQVAESKETNNQSPSFIFLQLFVCIIGVWLLHKAQEQ